METVITQLSRLKSTGFIHIVCFVCLTVPSLANATRTMHWGAVAKNIATKQPVENVEFHFVLTDTKSGKVTEQTCVTASSGDCQIQAEAEGGGLLDLPSNMVAKVTFKKDGFLPLANISWSTNSWGKIANFVLTPVGYPEEQERLAQAEAERIRLEVIEDQKRRELELQRSAKIAADLRNRLALAEERAMLTCASKAQCEKMFALTEIYITEHSSTKIQLATPTTITTYGPSDIIKPTFNAKKVPGRGDSSIVALTSVCKPTEIAERGTCIEAAILILNGFKPYMNQLLKN